MLRGLGWVVAAMCYALAAAVVVPLALALVFTPPGWAMLPFAAVFLAGLRARVRRRRATMVLAYVEQAMRMNLPLPRMIAAAAASETGRVRLRLAALADRLELGEPLWRAVREAAPEVSPRAVSLLERGERVGRLPEAVARLRDERRADDAREGGAAGSVWGYPLLVASGVLLAMGFFSILIAPKIIEIFEDFDATLPPITRALIQFGYWFVGWGGGVPGWVVLLSLLFCWAMLWLAWQAGFGRDLVGPALWWLPGVRRIERNRGMADVLFTIEQSLAAGVALPEALSEAAALEVNPVLRWRVERWQRRVDDGEGFAEAARRARMPALVAGMLETGAASGSLREALDFLRRYCDGRAASAALWMRAVAGPAAVLALACVVAWVVLALFVPLVDLVENGVVRAGGWVP